MFISPLAISYDMDISGKVDYLMLEDCPDDNCGLFSLGWSPNFNLGPKVDIFAKFLNCSDVEECKNAPQTLVGVELKGDVAVNVSGFIGVKYSSGSQCGENCLGGRLNPIEGIARASGKIEISFFTYELKYEQNVQFWDAVNVGTNCG